MEVLQKTPNVQSVDTPMKAPNTNNSLRIDVIAENGSQWIKVIARNPKALKDIALGCSNYGAKSVIDQAIDYVQCAEMNQCLFRAPQVRTILMINFARTILMLSLTPFDLFYRITQSFAPNPPPLTIGDIQFCQSN